MSPRDDAFDSYRPTRAEIDLDAIRHNCRALRALLGPATEHLVVVKGNAYGHGDVAVSRAAIAAGVDRLGVALVEEGVALRRAGIRCPILVLVDPPPAAAGAVAEYGLTATVSTVAIAAGIGRAAAARGSVADVHLAVDTGMRREGVETGRAVEVARTIVANPALRLEGVWTHMAVADEEDSLVTARQVEAFDEVLSGLRMAGIHPPLVHLANSPASLRRVGTHAGLVRTGVAVYGLRPAPWQASAADLRPAMRLVSAVAAVRPVRAGEGVSYGHTFHAPHDGFIATVPIGYADGYPRHLSSSGRVLIGGRELPVAGRVTMDQIMVDCGRRAPEVGEEVVLMGSQGAATITADDLADAAGTINYEIVTRIGPRVPRVYSEGVP